MALQVTVPLFIPGAPGGPELLIILFIAILLFGANKIPKLARSTGEAMGEFQKGKEKVDQELEEMRQTASLEDTPSEDTATSTDATTTESASTESPVDEAEAPTTEDEEVETETSSSE